MTDTITFNQALENFRIAKEKPRAYDERYKAVRDKYAKISYECEKMFYSYMSKISNDHIVFSDDCYRIFIVNDGKKLCDADYFYEIQKSKNYESFKNAVEYSIVRAIGIYVFNNDRDTNLDFISEITDSAKEIVNNITLDFYNGFKDIEKEYNRRKSYVYNFNKACDNRIALVDTCWHNLVRTWINENGRKSGTKLYVTTGSKWNRVRTLDYIKENKSGTTVYFTDGTRTNIDNIDFCTSFRYNCDVQRY